MGKSKQILTRSKAIIIFVAFLKVHSDAYIKACLDTDSYRSPIYKTLCEFSNLKLTLQNRKRLQWHWKCLRKEGYAFENSQQDEFALHTDIPIFTDVSFTNNAYNSTFNLQDSIPEYVQLHEENRSVVDINIKLNQIEKLNPYRAYISVPYSFWEKYYDGTSTLKRFWTNELNSYFQNFFPICVLSFKWHKCFSKNRKSDSLSFAARAECKHTNCANFKFWTKCSLLRTEENDMTVIVDRFGVICHDKNERFRRFVTGTQRTQLAQQLKHEKPSIVSLENLSHIPINILQSGNLNKAPSAEILRQISSKNLKSGDLSKDLFQNLILLKEKFVAHWPGKHIQGYIQDINYFPFGVRLGTEQQLRYLVRYSKKMKNVFCYLDATGSVVAKPGWADKRLFYYAFILPGQKNQSGPLPISEFILSSHTVPSICSLLTKFIYDLRNVIGFKSLPLIKKIETDFSFAMIQSVLKSFNSLDLRSYLCLTWNFLVDPVRYEIDTITVIHTCSSHIFKSACNKITKFSRNRRIRLLAKLVVSKLINSSRLSVTKSVFEAAVIVFGLPTKEIHFSNAIYFLSNRNSNDRNDFGIGDIKKRVAVEDRYKTLKKSSPFFSYFTEVYEKILAKSEDTERKNLFFLPSFVQYLIKDFMPFCPLWSGIIIKKFGIIRDSNASVENWFKMVKHDVFKNQMRHKVPRFIQRMESYLDSRMKSHLVSLKASKYRKGKKIKKLNDSLNITISQETWKEKKCNHFFPKTGSSLSYSSDILMHSTPTKNSTPLNFTPSPVEQIKDNITGYCDHKMDVKKILNFDKYLELPPWHKFERFPEYPKNPTYNKNLNEVSLNTLRGSNWLDDNVLNVFFLYLTQIVQQRGKKILVFDTLFTQKLDVTNSGFHRWAKSQNLFEYPVWLLPLNVDEVHWVLMVFNFKFKQILYIDSLHGSVPLNTLDKILNFININSGAHSPEWNQWTIYSPRDIPLQGERSNPGSNCGVHVCIWGHIICSGRCYNFSEQSMLSARIWIMSKILNYSENKETLKKRKKDVDLLLNEESAPTKSFVKPIRPNIFTSVPKDFISTLQYCSKILEHN